MGYLIKQGSLPSILVLFFVFLLFSRYFKFKFKRKYFYISIFSALLLAALIRSWFIATVIGILGVLYFNEKFRLKTVFTGVVVAAGLIFLAYSNPIFQERFSAGLQEIEGLSLNGNVQGNLTFRLLHTAERLDYISKNLQYVIFGIGNITEYDFPNTFLTGLIDKTGRVTQLDTADIAWSLLFLRFGPFRYVYIFIFLH